MIPFLCVFYFSGATEIRTPFCWVQANYFRPVNYGPNFLILRLQYVVLWISNSLICADAVGIEPTSFSWQEN